MIEEEEDDDSEEEIEEEDCNVEKTFLLASRAVIFDLSAL